ncbi:hypothetical protein GBAR_LOCUS25552, partial [Geodia barretti]
PPVTVSASWAFLSPQPLPHFFGVGRGAISACILPLVPPPISSTVGDLSGGLMPASSSAGSASGATKLHPPPNLLHSGPAVVLPPKVAKLILDLDFVEMSEISLD